MPRRHQFTPNAPVEEQLEHLREGTFEKYESDWTLIKDGASHEFTHNLGEVPCVVDVVRSEVANGDHPRDTASIIAIAKTDKSITVTHDGTNVNGVGDFYYRVRAF
jgi:hypothetical protein